MYVGVMNDNELAAKELYDVWSEVITEDIEAHGFKSHHQRWDELPELQRKAWIAVALHVVDESVDFLAMLAGVPDHR